MKFFEEKSCDKCFIRFNNPIKFLKKEEIEALYYEKACSFYKRGDVIYYEGSRGRGVYCVNKGIIKIYKTGTEGKPQIIRFAKEGDLIGFRSVMSQEPFCATAEVIEDAILCFIPAKIFIDLAKQNPDFSLNLIQLTCKELGESNRFIVDLAQKSIRERLASIILFLYDNFGVDQEGYIKIALTREEIANLVGTATESIIRLLSEFRKDGIIEIKKRKIKILNFKKLKFFANE